MRTIFSISSICDLNCLSVSIISATALQLWSTVAWLRPPIDEPITVSGLALALGLTSSELIELAGEDRAAALALARVEKAYEILIARSGKAAESFALRLLTRDPVRKSGGAEIVLGEGLEEYGG